MGIIQGAGNNNSGLSCETGDGMIKRT